MTVNCELGIIWSQVIVKMEVKPTYPSFSMLGKPVSKPHVVKGVRTWFPLFWATYTLELTSFSKGCIFAFYHK
jgi:hypothetical protein